MLQLTSKSSCCETVAASLSFFQQKKALGVPHLAGRNVYLLSRRILSVKQDSILDSALADCPLLLQCESDYLLNMCWKKCQKSSYARLKSRASIIFAEQTVHINSFCMAIDAITL